MDDGGELAGSISQMPDLYHLENLIGKSGAEIIRQADYVVLELDLNEHITQKVLDLARAYERPVYGIPGNLSVVMNNIDILGRLDCFICNNIEAERLIGVSLPAEDTASLEWELARFVAGKGLSGMVMTLGGAGCVYYDARCGSAGHQPAFPVTVIDTSGAGDAFFSGTVMGLMRGLSLKDAVACGTKVASWTIQSDENTCRDLATKAAADPDLQKILAGKAEQVI